MSKLKKIGLISFVVVVLLGALITYFVIQINDELDGLSYISIEEIDLATLDDGIYYGEYKTTIISAIVTVEVSQHEIIAITIVEHKSGQGQGAEIIVDSVINSQSLLVDSIAGATYSSKVILLAIEQALQ